MAVASRRTGDSSTSYAHAACSNLWPYATIRTQMGPAFSPSNAVTNQQPLQKVRTILELFLDT